MLLLCLSNESNSRKPGTHNYLFLVSYGRDLGIANLQTNISSCSQRLFLGTSEISHVGAARKAQKDGDDFFV